MSLGPKYCPITKLTVKDSFNIFKSIELFLNLSLFNKDKKDCIRGKTLYIINSYHGKLKSTYEIETDNAIPFLDILIIKQNNSIITNWYS